MRREKMVKEMRERFEYLKRRKVIDGLLVTVCGLVSKWNAKRNVERLSHLFLYIASSSHKQLYEHQCTIKLGRE